MNENLEEKKQERIGQADEAIRTLRSLEEQVRNEEVKEALRKTASRIGTLRDAQYLFDSGEKELIRLYERYLPYLFEIVRQYIAMENAGNFDAVVKHRKQLLRTLDDMNAVIRSVTALLPRDEIDEANARAKAEELKRQLEEQHRSVIQ